MLLILILLAWAATGIYRVDEAERGVVQRFGAYTVTTMPGIHWHLPFPIESVDIVNTNAVQNFPFRTEILTADEQYVFIQMVVQYRRTDPVKYSFEVVDPESTVQDVTESALREVIGGISMDEFLSGGRGEIVRQTKELTQSILDRYKTGLILTSVNLQDPQPPEEVQGAFEDAIKAREDEERYKNQAEAYALDILPKARGDAARLREASMAYRDKVIANAEGEASRFSQTRVEYEKAPEITRKRMYLETMEYVLANSSKVLMQVKDGNNLMYIPLDKLMENKGMTRATPVEEAPVNMPSPQQSEGPRRRTSSREGGTR